MSLFDKPKKMTLEEREKEAEAKLAALKKEMEVIGKEKEIKRLEKEAEEANPSFLTKMRWGLENMADNVTKGAKK